MRKSIYGYADGMKGLVSKFLKAQQNVTPSDELENTLQANVKYEWLFSVTGYNVLFGRSKASNMPRFTAAGQR